MRKTTTRIIWGLLVTAGIAGGVIFYFVAKARNAATAARQVYPAVDPSFSQTCQAEDATRLSGCAVETRHAGYLGAGYVALGPKGAWCEWNNIVAPAAGVYQVAFRYANGGPALNPCRVTLNGRRQLVEAPTPFAGTYAFGKTNGWTVWRELTIGMRLKAGRNVLRVTVESPEGGPAIDQITLKPNRPQAEAPAPGGAAGWARVPEILARIKPPQFPEREFDITRYGAAADGTTACQAAINKAIQACHDAGGGHVIVPAGAFMVCGTIRLLSGVDLHLRAGTRLNFRGEKAGYLPRVLTTTEGNLCLKHGLIYALEASNVAVTGEGETSVIDGGKSVMKWQDSRVHDYADVALAPEDRSLEEGRPQTVDLFRCQNVLLSGYRVTDSPFWTNVITNCRNATVKKLDIASFNSNNDGIDVQSCRDVLIEDCRFDTRDDCICIKAGRDRDGREILGPCQDVVIRRNSLKTQYAHLGLGSEISGGIRNIFVDENGVNGLVLVKSNYDRGGYVQDVFIRNCAALAQISMNFANGSYRGYYYPPRYANFTFENLPGLTTLAIEGREENPIRNVRLKNCGKPGGKLDGKRSHADNLIID